MTRRITLAILLCVWTMLLVAGVSAYVAIRATLLAELDATLVDRAATLPELVPSPPRSGDTPEPASVPTTQPQDIGGSELEQGGRYVIRAETDRRTLSRLAERPPMAGRPEQLSATSSTLADGHRVRTVTIRAIAKQADPTQPPTPVVVTYTGSAEPMHRVLLRITLILAACGGGAGIVAAVVAGFVSARSLRPLRDIARVVGGISERRLDRRVPLERLPPELLPVGRRLNRMIARLQQAFARHRRFLADASHELRTPVAALSTGIDVALARPRDAAAYRDALENAANDAADVQLLVRRLIELIRSEQLDRPDAIEDVDVTALLQRCVAMAATLGRSTGVTVVSEVPAGLRAKTSPDRLRSIVTNLLANAVEYSPGGTVTLSARVAEGMLQVRVQDNGPGIAEDQLDLIFEPFVRGDEARGRDGAHLGLGLSITRAHVQALGGTCRVQSTLRQGTVFDVVLPVIWGEVGDDDPAEMKTSAERSHAAVMQAK